MSPHGLILIHDVSSHLHGVREAALRLEPRGLEVAQKREGRK
jgi:hypothetical protein